MLLYYVYVTIHVIYLNSRPFNVLFWNRMSNLKRRLNNIKMHQNLFLGGPTRISPPKSNFFLSWIYKLIKDTKNYLLMKKKKYRICAVYFLQYSVKSNQLFLKKNLKPSLTKNLKYPTGCGYWRIVFIIILSFLVNML